MKVGEVVRYIRLSKKMKSKNVYTNILSRPAITKFENGLSDTTTEKLFKITSNLNVSLEEFYFIYNNYSLEPDYDFLNKYSYAFYSNDLETLKKLKNILAKKYKSTNKINHLHYSALCDLTISYISNNPINIESQNILNKYLLECEEWTYYEIVLFTNSLDFFPEELILLLYKRTKKKLEDFSQLRKYSNEVFSLLSNILVFFISKNDTSKCNYFYSELKNSIYETNNKMYEKTMMVFFKELINVMETKQLNNKNIETIISLFNWLEMPLKTIQCTTLVKTVKINNQIK